MLGSQNTRVAVASSFMLLVLNGLFFGFHLDNYHPSIKAIFEGFFTLNQPFSEFYFSAYLGIDFLLGILYNNFPSVNWYSLFLIGVNVPSAIIVGLIISKLLNQKGHIKVFGALIGSQLILGSSIWLIDVTYSITLFYISSTIYLFFFKPKFKSIILINVWMVFGAFTRFDTSLLSLVLFAPIFIYLSKSKTLLLVKNIAVPLLFAISISIGYYVNTQNSSNVFDSSTYDLYLVSDGNFRKPISAFTTPADSIKYEAVVEHFYNDPQNITPEFIKSMILSSKVEIIPLIGRSIGVFSYKLSRILKHYSSIVIVLIGAFVIIFITSKNKLKSAFITFLILFELLVILVVIKMEGRFMFPMLSGLIMVLLIFNLSEISKVNPYFLWGIVVMFSGLTASIQFQKSAHISKVENQNKEYLELIKTAVSDNLVLFDTKSGKIANTGAFEDFHLESNRFLSVDYSELNLWPKYQTILQNWCNCNTSRFDEYFKYIETSASPVYYCSTRKKFKFIQEYLRIVYNYNLKSIKEMEMNLPNDIILVRIN